MGSGVGGILGGLSNVQNLKCGGLCGGGLGGFSPLGPIHLPVDNTELEDIFFLTRQLDGDNARSGQVIRVEGTSITDITPSTGGNDYYGMTFRSIVTWDSNRNILYMIGVNDKPFVGGTLRTLWRSGDAGDSWVLKHGPVTTGSGLLPYNRMYVGGDNNGNTLYLLGSNGAIGISTDGGTTIIDKTGDIATHSPGSLVMLFGG